MEEAKRSVFDLFLVNTPCFAKIIENSGFMVQYFNSAFLGNILEAENTV